MTHNVREVERGLGKNNPCQSCPGMFINVSTESVFVNAFFPLGQLILSKYKFTYRFVYIQRVFCSYFPSGIIFLKLTFVCDILESFSKNICRVNSGNDIEWYHKEMIFWSNTMC